MSVLASCASVPAESCWEIDSLNPDPKIIALAASVIREGCAVIYPTETFYGLGADPMQEEAVEEVFRIKGRGFDKPIPLIATDERAVRLACAHWPLAAEKLARAFWPGPLTLVLPASADLPSVLHAGTGTIAVRVSSHPVARALSAAVGGLITSTSANAAGESPCRKPEEMSRAVRALAGGMLNAGALPGRLPSTIVDVTCTQPRLVRTGRLSWETINETLRL